MTEADTCREFVTPKLVEAGWGVPESVIGEQHSFDLASDLRSRWVFAPEFEAFDPIDPTLTQIQHVLVIELKKGGFELTRKEVNQADGYVQDIASSGPISGTPFISAWVVGQKVASGVERDKRLGNPEYGRVRAATFGSLVDTANARLLKLPTVLAGRYSGSSTDDLLNRVLSQPPQEGLGL